MSENTEEVMPYEQTVNSHFSDGKNLPIVEHILIDKSIIHKFPLNNEEQMFAVLMEIAASFFVNFHSDKDKEELADYLQYPALGFIKVVPFISYNPELITCIKVNYMPADKLLSVEDFYQYKADEIPNEVLDMINEEEENTKQIFKKFGDVPKER